MPHDFTSMDRNPDSFGAQRAHAFPALSGAEQASLSRFGAVRHYVQGAPLLVAGSVGPGLLVILAGDVRVCQRDGLGRTSFVASQGPGQGQGRWKA